MTFITGCLAIFLIVFCTMIAVAIIRIEKNILDLVDIVESKVTKLYGQDV